LVLDYTYLDSIIVFRGVKQGISDMIEINKLSKKLSERKAVSPVIATVILVAVAITVSVAVSYWMSSIAGQYTSFEKVEIQSAYAAGDATAGWTITLVMKNSGSATANLITAFVNDKPAPFATGITTGETRTSIPTAGQAIESGKTANPPVMVYIGNGLFSSGTTINIKIHSAGGMDYIRLVKLT